MLSQKGYTYVSLHKSLIYTLHLASILTSLLRQSQELFSNMSSLSLPCLTLVNTQAQS